LQIDPLRILSRVTPMLPLLILSLAIHQEPAPPAGLIPPVVPMPMEAALPVRIGQSAAEVRKQLGPPDRVARQILRNRYLEQWTYFQPRTTRITLRAYPGEELSVLTVHSRDGKSPPNRP